MRKERRWLEQATCGYGDEIHLLLFYVETQHEIAFVLIVVDTARIESSFGESNMQERMCAVAVRYYLHESCFHL